MHHLDDFTDFWRAVDAHPAPKILIPAHFQIPPFEIIRLFYVFVPIVRLNLKYSALEVST